MQRIIKATSDYHELNRWFLENGIRRVLLVCGNSLSKLPVSVYTNDDRLHPGVEFIRFSDFHPNPDYESVVKGVDVLCENACEAVWAIGGGSAMDVAKCIKLYYGMDRGTGYLEQTPVQNEIRLLAMPTTAGTGSEATRFAVIYHNGEKQSVTHDSIIPEMVLIDPGAIRTLPIYQKKATMMDAFCHAIESFWSVNSTPESMEYSANAIRGILSNLDGYLQNNEASNEGMLYAANEAGRAINITQTTAAHAMCYKLTALYGIAHGHAAALCLKGLFPWMLRNTGLCIDPRGEDHLRRVFDNIAAAMGCGSAEDAVHLFEKIFLEAELEIPVASEEDFALLRDSVNPVRLKNHPIRLESDMIDQIYHKILRCRKNES